MTTKRAAFRVRSINSDKRDLELLRNILILLCIYFSGGVPTMLFLVTANRTLYLIGIVTISFTVAVEKGCTIVLDRDMCQIVKNMIKRQMRIVPASNCTDQTGNRVQDITNSKRAVPPVQQTPIGHVSVC